MVDIWHKINIPKHAACILEKELSDVVRVRIDVMEKLGKWDVLNRKHSQGFPLLTCASRVNRRSRCISRSELYLGIYEVFTDTH